MTTINRRNFLKLAGAGIAGSHLGLAAYALDPQTPASSRPAAAGPIITDHQPQRIESKDGFLDVDLVARFANPVVNGRTLNVRTYNGAIPGPTLVARPGDILRVRAINQFPPLDEPPHKDINHPHGFNVINLHTHGLNVSPESNEDNVLIEVHPGETFEHEIHIPEDHPTGTFWYHPHKHGSAALHMSSGMAGFLLITGEGALEEIPEIAEAKDVLFMIQEMVLNEQNEVPNDPEAAMAELTSNPLFTINGLAANDYVFVGEHVSSVVPPEIHLRPGEVQRWRLCQANILQILNLQLEEHPLHIVAYDGITPEHVETVDNIVFAPGSRLDILVKAGEPGTYALQSTTLDQGNEPENIGTLFNVVVSGDPVDMGLPTTLNPPQQRLPYIKDEEIVRKRTITFDVTGEIKYDENFKLVSNTLEFFVNNKKFDPDIIDHTMLLNTAEEWVIRSDKHMDHPFHIHVNWFQLTEFDGQELDPPRWMDTINVPAGKEVTIRHRFENFQGKFVLHCHLLPHEDHGMMALIEVIDPTPSRAIISPTGGGNLLSNDFDNRVIARFPAGAVKADTGVMYTYHHTAPQPTENLIGVDRYFELTATQNGNPISEVQKAAIIEVRYPKQKEASAHLGAVRLYRWDEAEWQWVTTGINTLARTETLLTSTIMQFGQYALLRQCG